MEKQTKLTEQQKEPNFRDVLNGFLKIIDKAEKLSRTDKGRKKQQELRRMTYKILENNKLFSVGEGYFEQFKKPIAEFTGEDCEKLVERFNTTFKDSLEEAIERINKKIEKTDPKQHNKKEIEQARETIERFKELLENEVAMKVGEEKFEKILLINNKEAAKIARKLTLDKEFSGIKGLTQLKELCGEGSEPYYKVLYWSIDNEEKNLDDVFNNNISYLGETGGTNLLNAVRGFYDHTINNISLRLEENLETIRRTKKKEANRSIPEWIGSKATTETQETINQLNDRNLKSFQSSGSSLIPEQNTNQIKRIITDNESVLELMFNDVISGENKDFFPKNKEAIKEAFLSAKDKQSFVNKYQQMLETNLSKDSQQVIKEVEKTKLASSSAVHSQDKKPTEEQINQIAEKLFPSSFIGHNSEYSTFRLKNLFKYEDNKESSKKTLEDFIKEVGELSDKKEILKKLMKFVNEEGRKSGRSAITEEQMNNSLALINQNYFGGFCSGETGDEKLKKAINGSVLYEALNGPSPKITDPNEFVLSPSKSIAK